jgi:hypothetical protein
VSALTVEKPTYLLDHDWELEPHRLAPLLELAAHPSAAWLEDSDYGHFGLTWVDVSGQPPGPIEKGGGGS